MKPRVFVSSIIEGFSEFRSAARQAIIRSGGEPVLIEDYPSVSISPRNACLDGVHSCDIFVLLIGLRGGFVAPSGKLVIEEEYAEALKKRIPGLVFVQNGSRDEPAQALVDKVSDYVDGRFRKTFSTPDELGELVEESVKTKIECWSDMEYDISEIDSKMKNPFQINNETSLRFMLTPVRSGELADAVELDTEDFKRAVYETAHQRGVDLFSYDEAKANPEIEVDHVVYMQSPQDYQRHGSDVVRLEISTNGAVVIDTNVTGREKNQDVIASSLAHSVIHVDMLGSVLKKCFGFCARFYESRDAYRRFDPVAFNVCLSDIGYKQIVDRYPQGSVSMRMSGDDQVAAFDEPRIISRNDLMSADNEIKAVISMLKRRLKN